MEPRKVYTNRELKIPHTSFILTGYSRAAYRSGFFIQGLGIALDGGIQYFKKVSHYLITHTHTDHTANIPYSLLESSDLTIVNNEIGRPIIYCPLGSADLLDEKIMSSFRSNYNSRKLDDKIRMCYDVQGLEKNQNIKIIANKYPLTIRTFKSDHSVPTLVYGISIEKKKLKTEFVGMSFTELQNLRKSGMQLSGTIDEPLMSYILDSSIHTLEKHPELLDYPNIIIECTFLFDGEEELAENKKHIHWNDLLPYVKSHPNSLFILTHFSLRYSDEEIQDFFRTQITTHNLSNIYPWLTDIEFSLDDNEKTSKSIKSTDVEILREIDDENFKKIMTKNDPCGLIVNTSIILVIMILCTMFLMKCF